MDPDVVLGPSVFVGGLGYQGQQTTHVQENVGFLALPPKLAWPKNHVFLENVWLLGLGTPGLPQKHLANKTLRDPFEPRRSLSPESIEVGFRTSFGSPVADAQSRAQHSRRWAVNRKWQGWPGDGVASREHSDLARDCTKSMPQN